MYKLSALFAQDSKKNNELTAKPEIFAAHQWVFLISFAGRCWMDALELALKCSSLLKRTMIREGKEDMSTVATGGEHSINFYSLLRAHNIHGFQWVGRKSVNHELQLRSLCLKGAANSYHFTTQPTLPLGSMTATIWKTQTCTRTSQTGRVNRTMRSQTQRAWRKARRATATRQSGKTTHTSTWTLMNICGKPRTWNSPMRSWER